MFSVMRTVRTFAVLSTMAVAMIGAVQSATLDVSGVSGAWTGLFPTSGPTKVNGIGTSTVRWGTPYRGKGGTGEQSGYNFTGTAFGGYESDDEFDLGTFTHFNKTISIGTSITGADLGLAISIVIGGVPQAITAAFRFEHDETKNNGERSGLCKNGGANKSGVNVNGCADRVNILNNSGSSNQFTFEGVIYVLEITGFLVEGAPFSEFWTRERADNTAVLRARFREVGRTASSGGGGGDPTPSPIPLPGAAWLILSALAAMIIVGRKRQTA